MLGRWAELWRATSDRGSERVQLGSKGLVVNLVSPLPRLGPWLPQAQEVKEQSQALMMGTQGLFVSIWLMCYFVGSFIPAKDATSLLFKMNSGALVLL